MKKFALELLLFISLFLVFDKLFIFLGRQSANTEVDKRLEYLLKGEINKDIIILGSSTGSRGIIAGRIEKATGRSAYNLCYPGSNVEFHEFILRALLEFNSTPKLLLLVVDDDKELLYDETTTFRNDRLYPLVNYRFVRMELIERGEKDKILSKFLFLHQLNKANFDLRKKRFTPLDTILNCGSMPISWQREDRVWNYINEEREYCKTNELPEKLNAFEKIMDLCESNDIDVLVIFPPVYKVHGRSFEKRIKQLSGSDVTLYVYDIENSIYSNKDFYYDETHLINTAAEVFTDEIIRQLEILSAKRLLEVR